MQIHSVGSYVSFQSDGQTLCGYVTEVNEELKLLAVKIDTGKQNIHWITISKARAEKRKPPPEFEPADEDTKYSPGDLLTYYDGETGKEVDFVYVNEDEKNGLINPATLQIPRSELRVKVKQRAPKRPRGLPPDDPKKPSGLAPTSIKYAILDLIMAYVGEEPSRMTWVERHAVSKWYMGVEGLTELPYAEENDRLLGKHIRSTIGCLTGLWSKFWEFVGRSCVITGSSLVALAHAKPQCILAFGDPKCAHRFTHGTRFLFGMHHFATPSDEWECGDVNVLLSGGTSASDLIRNTGSTGGIFDITSQTDTSHIERALTSYKMKCGLATVNVTSVDMKRELIHDSVLKMSDLSLLCISFDGTTLRIGDGSIKARDELAGLVSRFDSSRSRDKARAGDRFYKYVARGVSIEGVVLGPLEIPLLPAEGQWLYPQGQLNRRVSNGDAFMWDTDHSSVLVTRSGVWTVPRPPRIGASRDVLRVPEIDWSKFDVKTIVSDLEKCMDIIRFGSSSPGDEHYIERILRLSLPGRRIHCVSSGWGSVRDRIVYPALEVGSWSMESEAAIMNRVDALQLEQDTARAEENYNMTKQSRMGTSARRHL